MSEYASLSPQQLHACLALARDRDVDRTTLAAAIEAMAQAGTLNAEAAKALRQFSRATEQELSARGSVTVICAQILQQDPTRQQVVGDLNDSKMNFALGTGMMLVSDPAIPDSYRQQYLMEGISHVLAQYLRERAPLALKSSEALNSNALADLRAMLYDSAVSSTLGDYVIPELAELSRSNSEARALFLGLLHEENIEDWKQLKVTQALAGMLPLETPEVEALRLAVAAAKSSDARVYAAQTLLLADAQDARNVEAVLSLLRELKTTGTLLGGPFLRSDSDPEPDEAESEEEEFQNEASEDEDSVEAENWLQWMSDLLSHEECGEAVFRALAHIAGAEGVSCTVRDAAFWALENVEQAALMEEAILAQCLRQSECASVNRRAANLLYKRETLQPQTLTVMVDIQTDKQRHADLRREVAFAFKSASRLLPEQAQRLFGVVEDKKESGQLRGQIISILAATQSLTEPMFALLTEWFLDTAAVPEIREQATFALMAAGRLQRAALLSFLNDGGSSNSARLNIGAAIARTQTLDAEMLYALLRLLALPDRGDGMMRYPLSDALWEAARQDAAVFTLLLTFLRDPKEDVSLRAEFVSTLYIGRRFPKEMSSALRAIADDKSVESRLRQRLQSALKRR